MHRIVALVLTLGLLLLVGAPVSAVPPVVEEGSFEVDYEPFDPPLCPGIEVRDHEVGTYRLTTYFDQQGHVVRIHAHYQGTDTVYNAANPDTVLSGTFSANAAIDPATGEIVLASGAAWHITAPGYGTVMVRAGRWHHYPDEKVAGKDSWVLTTDLAQFCALLAGDG